MDVRMSEEQKESDPVVPKSQFRPSNQFQFLNEPISAEVYLLENCSSALISFQFIIKNSFHKNADRLSI